MSKTRFASIGEALRSLQSHYRVWGVALREGDVDRAEGQRQFMIAKAGLVLDWLQEDRDPLAPPGPSPFVHRVPDDESPGLRLVVDEDDGSK